MHHRRLLANATTSELAFNNGNRTSDSYISETNFDTNMVIILAALLCALICALGLNSIVRCTLRCSHRFALETPEQVATRLAATGLKKSHLRQLPVAIYGEKGGEGEEEGMHIPATECPICLGEFVEGEKVRVLPKCKHGFHVRCIDTWLVSHSSCPNYRHSLLEHQQLSNKTRTTTSRGRDVTSGTSSEATSNGESNQVERVVLVIDE